MFVSSKYQTTLKSCEETTIIHGSLAKYLHLGEHFTLLKNFQKWPKSQFKKNQEKIPFQQNVCQLPTLL